SAALTVLATTYNMRVGAEAQIKSKNLDAQIQQAEREDERKAADATDKRATYVQLNAAARDYRAIGHTYLMYKLQTAKPENNEEAEKEYNKERHYLDQIEKARAKYRKVYSRAQMICPGDVFNLADEVNDCLGHSHRTIVDLSEGIGGPVSVETLHKFYDEE